ncbi:MAG: hypothetical protein PHH49_02060 [Candidatus Omnitrophica bacterium]|nr:hypothetical protein [Candidatus Omnitrophota bacterium]MDD5487730.1 hypothetical protein [Candidatus Omnitrophota bacterium]
MIGAENVVGGLEKRGTFVPDVEITGLMMEEVDPGMLFMKETKIRGINIPVFLLPSGG